MEELSLDEEIADWEAGNNIKWEVSRVEIVFNAWTTLHNLVSIFVIKGKAEV